MKFVEQIGGEALDLGAQELASHKDYLVARADAVEGTLDVKLKAGVDAAIKEKGNLLVVGPIIQNTVNAGIDTLFRDAEGETGPAIDELVAWMQSEAKTLEAE